MTDSQINKSVVRIGKFDLWEFINYDGKKLIWIGLADDGEGCAFDEAELEKVIEGFYGDIFDYNKPLPWNDWYGRPMYDFTEKVKKDLVNKESKK